MNQTQRKQIQKLLFALKSELSGKDPNRIDPNRTFEADVGGDEDEQPLNEMIQTIASTRNRNQGTMLLRVEKAIRRLQVEPHDFGACEDCGEEVGLGRLKAMPYAELCVNCQGKKDGPKGRPTRRNLTDFN